MIIIGTTCHRNANFYYFHVMLEPGFYQEDEFGIRIEDVVQAVTPTNTKILRGNFDNVGALQFYHVTMVPIQVSLIKIELLTHQEVGSTDCFGCISFHSLFSDQLAERIS